MRFRYLFNAVAIAGLAAGLASAQTIQISRDNKTIAITTSDEATAVADVAAASVGFENFGANQDSTYAEGGRLSQAIMAALHKAGVTDKDVESTGQGLQRNMEFNEKESAEERARKQWVFRQSWNVTVSPSSVAEVIRMAIAAGANKTGNIDWKLSDRKALEAKAAEAALVKARTVAERMAEGLHVKLGDLIYASNEAPNAHVFPVRGSVMGMLKSNAAVPAPAPALEIRPQTIREEATVYAVFAIQ